MVDLAGKGFGGRFNPSFVAIHDIIIASLEANTNFPQLWNFKPFPHLNNNQILSNPSSIALDILCSVQSGTAYYALYQKHHKVSFSHYFLFDIIIAF